MRPTRYAYVCIFCFQLILYEQTQARVYLDDITSFLDNYNGGYVPQTPCGLSYRDQWGPNRHAGMVYILHPKSPLLVYKCVKGIMYDCFIKDHWTDDLLHCIRLK